MSSEGESTARSQDTTCRDGHMLGNGEWEPPKSEEKWGSSSPGSFFSSSSWENLIPLGEPSAHPAPPSPEGLVRGAVPRAEQARCPQPDDGKGGEALGESPPARDSSRNPAGKEGSSFPGTAPAPFPLPPGSGVPEGSPAGIWGVPTARAGPSRPGMGGSRDAASKAPGMSHPRNSRVNRNVSGSAPATCCRR